MRPLLLSLVLVTAACSHLPSWMQPHNESRGDEGEALYWTAVSQLDAANQKGSLDSAIALLGTYLASSAQAHRAESLVLRQLARDAQQLAKLQSALQTVRVAGGTEPRPQTETKAAGRDEEALKEIQRLKDELAKANEELERIRKRLAAPTKAPTG